MHLPDLANAPRRIRLGSAIYRVSAATLADFAELIGFIDGHIEAPEGAPRAPFSSTAAQDALFGPDGLPLVVFLALRRHHPATTLDEAATLALSLDPDEVTDLASAFFRRRKTYGADDDGEARDLVDVIWGQQFEMVCRRPGWTYERLLSLSLDQYENAITRGNVDAPWEGRAVSLDEAQALWEEAMRE